MSDMTMQDNGKLYSVGEVAALLGLAYKTIWKWCRVTKTLRCIVLPSGTLRIPEAELRRLMTESAPTPEA